MLIKQIIMDYSKFTFSAVVDWIEIAVETQVPTNFGTVKRHGGFSFVTAIEPNEGGGATRFLCRIQDPKDPANVRSIIKRLAQTVPLRGDDDHSVSAIEVSFDAYSKGASSDELIALTANFYKFLTRPVSTNRRFSGIPSLEKTTAIPFSYNEIRSMIRDKRVIAIGNHYTGSWGEVSPMAQRIYFKTYDAIPVDSVECEEQSNAHKRTYQRIDLPADKHRARVEITLRDEGLPIKKLSDFAWYRFESLTEFFQFRMLKSDLHPLLRLIKSWLAQVGERIEPREQSDSKAYLKKLIRRRKSGSNLLYDPATCADSALNDRSKGALKRLSDRWKVK